MPRLRFSAESKDDLKQIATYIAHDKPIAARQLVPKSGKSAVSWQHIRKSAMNGRNLAKAFDLRTSVAT